MNWLGGFLIGVVMTFLAIIIWANVSPPPAPVCAAPSQGLKNLWRDSINGTDLNPEHFPLHNLSYTVP